MKINIHVVTSKRKLNKKQFMRYLIELQPLLIVLIPYFISLFQYILHLND